MPKVAGIDDKQYLSDQYRDAANLNARIALHKRFSTNPYGWLRWVFDRITLPPECRILELGCGPGYLWLENISRIPTGWEITLSDSSNGMLRQARENMNGCGRPFLFEIVDAQFISYSDSTFDAVIANHMLYHVPDRAKALWEMRRVLRPGGRFFASTIGDGHLSELADLAAQFDPELVSWGGPSLARGTFTLENGAAQIAPLFTDISLHRYEDAFVVTEPEPLVDYVLSGRVKLDGEERAKFFRYVEKEMKRRGGAIRIGKESGIFEAVRP
jgi:SAM-dependent methyltransferase